MSSLMMVNGKTLSDYFHFVCDDCGESLDVKLRMRSAVPSIMAACRKCGAHADLKLFRTIDVTDEKEAS